MKKENAKKVGVRAVCAILALAMCASTIATIIIYILG